MKVFQNRNYNLFGYLNIVLSLIASLIVYVPMALYISKYQHYVSINADPHRFIELVTVKGGYYPAGSLSSSLIITFLCSAILFGLIYMWIKDLELKGPSNTPQKVYKAIKYIGILSITFIILLLVSFFIAWLSPMMTSKDQISNARHVAFRRIIVYACLGTIFTFFNLGTAINGLVYVNLRISYTNHKKEVAIEESKEN